MITEAAAQQRQHCGPARAQPPAYQPWRPLQRPGQAHHAVGVDRRRRITVAVRAVDGAAAVSTPNPAAAAAAAAPEVAAPMLVYSGVVFDMDGTLTISNIDYVTMRQKTEIPVGDLFTVMESWDEGERIVRSMDVILELEEQACTSLQPQPGLLGLLAFLRASGVKVGLVTRNTTESLNAFFQVIGEEWRGCFDIMVTRDNFPYCKPDKRSLLHFAEAWDLSPWELLMVGDSTEDIETANAAGTASCLIAGGGNETASAAAALPPRGAVPTFTVDSLAHLQERLAQCNTALGWGAYGNSNTLSLSSASSWDEADFEGTEDGLEAAAATLNLAGAPPEGLDFLDALLEMQALRAASCSFPRVQGSRAEGPLDQHPGDRVLHLECGNGALTKLLFSSGLQVIGVDEEVEAAVRRGLPAVALSPLSLGAGALEPELAAAGHQRFDAAVYYNSAVSTAAPGAGLADSLWRPESLAEVRRVLKPGGRLCVQAPVEDEEEAREQLVAAGFSLLAWQRCGPGVCRVVASTP